ncbi:hypothetical protein CONLIGDRAFT_694061 [Coniochaeta ligniaria NRRL 30616]|uniref:Transferase family protein n=1 Tax=Coniochaeta ligniaria NRRL 30616 TaxID=1408157 RepID=A0A1J7I6W2_9PEZI|nr:hypothetical protein CONLIGDRAFT_694061 [Coniochaeta ligniaria NRRL 30616]
MSIVLCFRVDDNNKDTLSPKHIHEVLASVVTKRPDFARHLILDPESPSRLCVQAASSNPVIPCHLLPVDFSYSFSELEAQNFPAAAFVDPKFIISGDISSEPKPVVQIQLLYIKEGLLMFTYLHHAYGDGSCMDDFLTVLASHLAPKPESNILVNNERTNVDFDIGSNNKSDRDFNTLLQQCPEYSLLPTPTGPTQPILAPIDLDMPTYNFLALRALLWAHTTKARLATEGPATRALFAQHKPNFCNPHNWNLPCKTLFPTASSASSLRSYFGNAIAIARTTLPLPPNGVDLLLAATTWPQSHSHHLPPPAALLSLIRAIDVSNASISPAFVATRTALFRAAPDIRYLGIAHDARAGHTFSANTWRFLGGRAGRFWDGEGVGGTRCVAIRRVQGEWGFPHGLVMPGRPGVEGGDLEVLVTLDEAGMRALEEDEGWMGIVEGGV